MPGGLQGRTRVLNAIARRGDDLETEPEAALMLQAMKGLVACLEHWA
jgi:hypothetical protein